MKKYFIFVFLILLLSTVLSCTIDEVTTNDKYSIVDSNSKIIVSTTEQCENYNINVFARDLMTLKDYEIYDGEITGQVMELNYKNNSTPTVTKIYASTYPKISKKSTNQAELESTPIITSLIPGNIILYFSNRGGIFNPETYEYENEIDLNFYVSNTDNNTNSSDFGFYLENNDFNIISITGDFNTCIRLDAPYTGCRFGNTYFESYQTYYFTVKITKIKSNEIFYTFGTDGPGEFTYDFNKPVFAKPFITINNIEKNIDQNFVTIDYNMYNAFDINYCSLIIDGNETQRDYNIQTDNQFIQTLNQGEYTADINCVTSYGHITYPSPNFHKPEGTAQPSADNYPIYLDQSLEILFYPFERGNGTENNPFELNECSQLNLISEFSESNFVLKNDLNCNGETIYPINNFNGILDGNGYVIYDLTINSPLEDNVGLFSILNGTAKRVGLENANITGKNNVGAIAGVNNGSIEQVSVNGSVNGEVNVGGIAGVNERIEINNGFPHNGASTSLDELKIIKDSYSTANISGQNSGGIAGTNKGLISNTYHISRGEDSSDAGIAGVNYTKCYDYSHFIRSGIIQNSFSNTQTVNANSCYSRWYYGAGALENGTLKNNVVNSDLNYPSNLDNPPFNTWDFETIWKDDIDFTVNNGYPYLQPLKK